MRASPPSRAGSRAETVRRVMDAVGGRYSTDLGIDLDGGSDEVERWFVAATLFGNRISVSIAGRTFHALDREGLTRVGRLGGVTWERIVDLLDEGGYVRYDFRTATRLRRISEMVDQRFGGEVAAIGREYRTYPSLREVLDLFPGWGPVTVELFLRELRGVWPGAEPPLDERAARAAGHLGLLGKAGPDGQLRELVAAAQEAGVDARDLESGLVKVALAHHGRFDTCPEGEDCRVLAATAR